MHNKSISFNALPSNIKFFIIVMIAVIVSSALILTSSYNTLIMDGYNSRSFTLLERTLTETRIIVMYLFQIITPFPSFMGFFHDDITISKSIIHPKSTLLSILFVVFSIILAFIRYKKYPLLAYGLLFFYTSHLIESSIFPLEIAFEHRNYIGVWGILLSIFYLLKRVKLDTIFIICSICLILSALTFKRATIWNSPNTMYPYMLSIHPNSKRLHTIFSNTYASSGNYDKALEYIVNDDGFGVKLQRLSIQCQKNGVLEPGSLLMSIQNESAIKIGTHEMEGIIGLSNLGLDNKCSFSKNEFIEFLLSIITSSKMNSTDSQKSFIYLAHYYHSIGKEYNAIKALERSFNKDKQNPIPLFLMVEWLIDNNRINEAIITFKKARLVASHSLYDYSDFINRIAPMLSKQKYM